LGLSTLVIKQINQEGAAENSESEEHESELVGSERVQQKICEEANKRKTKKGPKHKETSLEERKPSGRTDTDLNVMDKAMERAKVKNLDIPQGETILPLI
jgi:hypothetical protein